jgi:hypothetical protein
MNPMVAGAGVQLGLASELYHSIKGISEVLSCMFELGRGLILRFEQIVLVPLGAATKIAADCGL